MKICNIRKLAAQTLLAAVMGMAATSSMAATSWGLDTCATTLQANGTGQQTTNSGNFGNSYKCAAASGVNTNNVTVTAYGAQTTSGGTSYNTGYLTQWGAGSGFGVASRNEGLSAGQPEHAMDNNPASVPDLILLKFDTAVALGQVTLGWTQNDADITVMAYTGAGGPTITGKTAATLTTGGAAAGWKMITNYGDVDTAYTPTSASGSNVVYVNSSNVTSSWWLISAYNSSFGGGTLDTYNLTDYVKFMSVASKDVKVPEPASLALVGLALLGVAGTRRIKKSA